MWVMDKRRKSRHDECGERNPRLNSVKLNRVNGRRSLNLFNTTDNSQWTRSIVHGLMDLCQIRLVSWAATRLPTPPCDDGTEAWQQGHPPPLDRAIRG